jgi:hypothetical protein
MRLLPLCALHRSVYALPTQYRVIYGITPYRKMSRNIMREERGIAEFENRMLKRIFGV